MWTTERMTFRSVCFKLHTNHVSDWGIRGNSRTVCERATIKWGECTVREAYVFLYSGCRRHCCRTFAIVWLNSRFYWSYILSVGRIKGVEYCSNSKSHSGFSHHYHDVACSLVRHTHVHCWLPSGIALQAGYTMEWRVEYNACWCTFGGSGQQVYWKWSNQKAMAGHVWEKLS